MIRDDAVSPRWPWAFALVPLAFIVYTWITSGGVPYFTDANETYSTFTHATNMHAFNPWANAILTDEGNSSSPGAHPFTYTHQPNLPRYLSYVLMVAGVRTLEGQVLIASLLLTGAALWFMRDLFGGLQTAAIAAAMLAFFVSDFMGVLQWTSNLFRVWHLPLFWGCLWCARPPVRPWLTFMMFFLLFQLEFAFAIFTTVTCLCVMLTAPKGERSARALVVMLAGATVSVGVFVAQLLSFYGWDGFRFDLGTAYAARNSTSVSWESIRTFYEQHNVEMWPSFPDTNHGFLSFLRVTYEYLGIMYSPAVRTLALWGMGFSVVLNVVTLADRAQPTTDGDAGVLIRAHGSLSRYLYAMIAGYVALGLTISGYTLTTYTQRWGPMLAFPMITGLTLLAVDVVGIILAVLPGAGPSHGTRIQHGLVALAVSALLIPWVSNSVAQYRRYPPLLNPVAHLLRGPYRGHTFVSYTTYPQMIAYYTGTWAYYSPLVFTPMTRLDQTYDWNADRLTNRAYLTPEYYLCQQVPYMRHIDCDRVAGQMEAKGHRVVERGKAYSIIKLRWANPMAMKDESQ